MSRKFPRSGRVSGNLADPVPDTLRRAFQKAVDLHTQGRYAEALTAYQAILAECPEHVDTLANLGSLLRRLQQPAAAISCLQQAVQLAPQRPEMRFNLGNALHAVGDLAGAAACFRHILDHHPEMTEAVFNLANVLRDQEDLSGAVALYRQFLRHHPGKGAAQANLGTVLRRLGHLAESEAAQRRAIALEPNHAGYRVNLGNLLVDRGDFGSAIDCYRAAIALAAGQEPWEWQQSLLGLLMRTRRWAEATQALQAAVGRFPTHPELYMALGNALWIDGQSAAAGQIFEAGIAAGHQDPGLLEAAGIAWQALGDWQQAERRLRQAVALAPQRGSGLSNLGMLLIMLGQHEAAIRTLQEAIRWEPDLAVAHANLGLAYLEVHELTKAEGCCRETVRLDPEMPVGIFNLAPVLMGQGRLPEALTVFAEGLARHPGEITSHSSYLFALNYSDGHTPEAVAMAHREFGRLVDMPDQQPPPVRDPDPERPLRIGYLSADFCHHPIGMLLAPILANHDQTRFQTVCYAHSQKSDSLTHRIQAQAGSWVAIPGLTDQEARQRIQADGIDILVDLAGHTKGNRLSLFARRPAPLQVSYAGYVHGTGLATMDWVIHDQVTVTEAARHLYTEQIATLPCALYCYQPPEPAPPVVPTPARQRGYITFGSFNNLPKLTPTTLDLWAAILHRVPKSRLLLKSGPFYDLPTRERICTAFVQRGIDPERLELQGPSPFRTYLETFGQIDLALDPMPFNGGITSLQGLWQGVPLVTLLGDRHVARVGASLMQTLGLPAWIADTPEAYVNCAVHLAADPEHLNQVRLTMRERMRATTLGDPLRFTRHLEAAFRDMWQKSLA
ncbi:MAG: tetratricopeptide repeat protein [Magnetococcales bacterium]|nr:tetratricopeptide repeat protein [Magnetococcales bacterium]